MDKILKENIKTFARNCIELNPDKGAITAVKEGAEFHDVELSESETEFIAFELLFEDDDDSFNEF